MSYFKTCKERIDYVIDLTHEYYMKCDSISEYDNNNIVGLYFHEIVRLFATIILRKEIAKYRGSNNNQFMQEKLRFGYRNNASIYKFNKKLGKRRSFISLLAKMLFFLKRPTLFLGDVSINNYKIILSAYLKGYKVSYLNYDNKVFIDQFDDQYKVLIELIKALCDFAEINFDKTLQNDINDAQSIISLNSSTIKMFKNKDVVLIGSPGKVNNRINSINAHVNSNKVIGVLHSDESGAVNYKGGWRYDDRSNCTHLIGYGPFGDHLKNKNDNFMSLSGRDYSYIQSDSEICRKVFNKDIDISKLLSYSSIHKQKGLYITKRTNDVSVLSANPLIDPIDYLKWQRFLLNNFQKVFVKKHPKQYLNDDYENPVDSRANLGKIVKDNDYDYFIIDNVTSTAFNLIAASNKPIIYFNIETPELTELAEKSIKERVLWVDIDIFSNYDGFDQYKNYKISPKFKNNYTEMFSLSINQVSRVNALFSAL